MIRNLFFMICLLLICVWMDGLLQRLYQKMKRFEGRNRSESKKIGTYDCNVSNNLEMI